MEGQGQLTQVGGLVRGASVEGGGGSVSGVLVIGFVLWSCRGGGWGYSTLSTQARVGSGVYTNMGAVIYSQC